MNRNIAKQPGWQRAAAFRRRINAIEFGQISSAKSFNERAEIYGCFGRLSDAEVHTLRKSATICFWCGCKINTLTMRATLDHVLPLSFKGPNIVQNLVPACKSCNSKKSNSNPMAFALTIGKNISEVEFILSELMSIDITTMDKYIESAAEIKVYSYESIVYGTSMLLVKTFDEFMEVLRPFTSQFRPDLSLTCFIGGGRYAQFRALESHRYGLNTVESEISNNPRCRLIHYPNQEEIRFSTPQPSRLRLFVVSCGT